MLLGCSACRVGMHDDCIRESAPLATCGCFDTTHTLYEVGWLKGGPQVKERVPHGPTADVDYELEPYLQVGPLDKDKGGKYGKPKDDLEAARAQRNPPFS
jgi:hypothetical protein